MTSPLSEAIAVGQESHPAAADEEGGCPQPTPIYTLDTLPFDNAAVRELPVDVEHRNYVRIVPDACFSRVAPDPVSKPLLVAKSDSALALLGLRAQEGDRDDAAVYFSGKWCNQLRYSKIT